MVNTANITAVITAQDKASAVLQSFGSTVDKTAEQSTSSLTKLNTSFLAVAAATAGLVAFGKKSLDAFNQQDLAVTRLKAGIQNVSSATDKNVDSLIKQAAALQKTTRFSDEAYISAQGILSTFQLNQDAIAKLTPRLADMSEGLARVTGEMPDLESNAILVAKAIGGEDVNGLTGVLRKAGVLFTKTQEELLKTGTVEDRVAVITKVLDQNFNHLAEQAGKTTAGKMAELKNQFNELEESVGGVIARGLTPLLNILLKHPAILSSVTIAVWTLTAAFVALKVSAAISTTFGMTAASIAEVGTASTVATTQVGFLNAALATPMVLTIGVAAALIAIQQVYNSYIQTKQTIEQTIENVKASVNSANDAITKLNTSLSGTPAEAERAQNALLKMGVPQSKINQTLLGPGSHTFAGGTDYAPGGMALVGEQGPEVINLPRGSQVISSDKLGGSVNITIQAGAFMGNDVEARKFATMIVKYYNDAMASKSRPVMA